MRTVLKMLALVMMLTALSGCVVVPYDRAYVDTGVTVVVPAYRYGGYYGYGYYHGGWWRHR